MLPLTKRQSEILAFLNSFMGTHGYAPSIDEIGRHFGLTSLATVHKHLENLKQRGYITRHWGRSRSIAVVAGGPVCPTCQRAL